MKKEANVLLSTTNSKELTELTNRVKSDVKSAKSFMWYVNNLNKLYVKNAFVDNTNIKEFGKEFAEYCMNHGIECNKKAPFNMYVFTKVNGVPCYKKTVHKKAGGAFFVDVDIITWQTVNLSENGIISAYKYLMNVDKKVLDKQAREHNKQVNKSAKKSVNAAKKALKQEQEQARELYNIGKLTLQEFASIMAKVA